MEYGSALYSAVPSRLKPLIRGLYYTIYPKKDPRVDPPVNAAAVFPEHDAPSRLPQEMLADVRVLSDRRALLEAFVSSKNVAELGVNEGEFSADILGIVDPDRLDLVDPWDSERYGQEKEQFVRGRFADEIDTGQVGIHTERSQEFLQSVAPGSFDLVYIDTTHAYPQTMAELHLAADAVGDTGVIAGHDYCLGNPPRRTTYGTIPAVHEFVTHTAWRLSYLTLETHGHRSFALTRR